MRELHNTIIYLIGIPAVGKYTVTKELSRLAGTKVVDNPLIKRVGQSALGFTL